MPQRNGFADGYVPVSERIAAFYTKYPEGSLQSEIITLTDSVVVFTARAYRSPTDERPGIGHSSLNIPGSTPFTRGSEVENCETSAWGRAIAALGFEVKEGIATAEEVRNKEGAETTSAPAARPSATPRPAEAQRPSVVPSGPSNAGMTAKQFFEATEAAGVDRKKVSEVAKDLFGQWQVTSLTGEQRSHLLAELTHKAGDGPGAEPAPPFSGDDGAGEAPDTVWTGVA